MLSYSVDVVSISINDGAEMSFFIWKWRRGGYLSAIQMQASIYEIKKHSNTLTECIRVHCILMSLGIIFMHPSVQ